MLAARATAMLRVTVARVLVGVAVAVLGAGALAGCTNSSAALAKNPHTGTATASEVAGVQRVVVHTGPDLRFHPSTLIVHRGMVHVVLKNKAGSGPLHNLKVTGLPGAFVPLTGPGQVGETTFDAPQPGRYRFECTIHVQQGQTGTLIVRRGS